IKKYWDLASQEISLFTNHDVVIGAAWPYQTNTLQAASVPVADTIPAEGATGWADTWMLGTKAPQPNCAYQWYKSLSTPHVQARRPRPGAAVAASLDAGRAAAWTRANLVRRHLPRVAGVAADHRLLADQPLYDGHRAGLEYRQLPHPGDGWHLPADHPAHHRA